MKSFVAVACALCAGATIISAASSPPGSSESSPTKSIAAALVLDRFLQSGKPELASYVARRVLEASTKGGRMEASLEALTYLDPDGRFRYEVIRESGSSLIREHVLLGALNAEQRSRNRNETGQAELTAANYDFRVEEDAWDGLVIVRVFPRRRSRMLVDGAAIVREENGDLVRIEGRLSQSPSWWTKRVDIVRSYARIAGVRVPVAMFSRAEVRLVGDATFQMTYDYTMINGRPVACCQ